VSDGHGSVSEWAAAAKLARVDLLCFAETFEYLKHDLGIDTSTNVDNKATRR
jgi:hypothetical protein